MTEHTLAPFWICWFVTLFAASWQVLRTWKRPREMLGFPTVACVLWLYIYCYLPYFLITEHRNVLHNNIWNLGQFTACISLLALLGSWHWKLRDAKPRPTPKPAREYDLNRVWWGGVGALLVGLTGFYTFVRSGSNFEGASAYWYLLFYACYPGMALCVATMTLSPRHRSPVHWGAIVLLASLIIVPLLYTGRRGPSFVGIVVLFFSHAAFRRRAVRPALLLAVLGAAGLLMLVLVAGRALPVNEGGTWREALRSLSTSELFEGHARRLGDNEYFNHCQMLQANLETGYYQYGTVHLAVMLNWIPRSWWSAKPQRSTGFLPEAFQSIDRAENTVESNLGYGGAWGPVADSFNNYWYFFPAFWLAIGWLSATAYVKGERAGELPWKLYNLGILSATHWFIAQCFSEAFVPFMFFEGTYFSVLWFAKRRVAPERGKTRTRRKSLPQAKPSQEEQVVAA